VSAREADGERGRSPDGDRSLPLAGERPLLSVQDLHVSFRTAAGPLRAVAGLSFELPEGGALGLVGESGCGKTTTVRAILRLLPPNGEIAGGRILFRGCDLTTLSRAELRKIRWRGIAMVTQSAMNALDPVARVGAQIVEVIRAHEPCSRHQAWDRAEHLFETVGLKPEWTRRYPHEFSGGMRQRAIIAMALALDPPLLIADEPTTALDVIVQDQIYTEITAIRAAGRRALILITHDISLVAENCDRVAVMYAGRLVEAAPVREVFRRPFHPYTIGLQNAFPNLRGEGRELVSIAGAPPSLLAPPAGCAFAPRCPFVEDRCRTVDPPLAPVAPGHLAACHFSARAEEFRERGRHEATWEESVA
jgi:peptide/nickel transport system ATP-binding protein